MEEFLETCICASSIPKEKRHALVHKTRRYVKLGDDLMVCGNDGVLRKGAVQRGD